MPLMKSVNYYALPREANATFRPKYIYYFKIGLKGGIRSPAIFKIIKTDRWRFPSEMSRAGVNVATDADAALVFQDLINEKLGPGPRPGDRTDIDADRAARMTTPLDFHFKDECFILVELDRKYKNWWFDLNFLGVTAKEDYGDKNGAMLYLKEVDDHLEIFSLEPYAFDQHGGVENCCAVMFGIFKRKDNERDHRLNLHTMISYGRAANGSPNRLPTIFDPDIKNDGGGIPPGGG